MIVPTKNGKFILKSRKTGKNLSKPTSKAGARKREKQVEYFKYKNERY